jgi:hypothetical protein
MEYNNGPAFDFVEIILRIARYLIEGLVVSTAAYLLPNKKQSLEDIIMIGFVAASVLSLLDLFAPVLSVSARQGIGLGIGMGLSGFPSVNNGPQIDKAFVGPK